MSNINGKIYIITNTVNGKQYIGQTIRSIKNRFNSHYNEVRHGMAITKAMRKYGKDKFIIDLICECNTYEELNNKESFYINLYNTLSPNGYNLCGGADNKKAISEETRKKLSESHLGHTHNRGRIQTQLTRYNNSDKKPIIAINLDNNKATIYCYKSEAKYYGFRDSDVNSVLNKKRKHCKRHVFFYYDEYCQYANQSGSEENKESLHAPRLEGEPAKAEHNPSKSPLLPNNFRGKVTLEDLIFWVKELKSITKVADKFGLSQAAVSLRLKRNGIIPQSLLMEEKLA